VTKNIISIRSSGEKGPMLFSTGGGRSQKTKQKRISYRRARPHINTGKYMHSERAERKSMMSIREKEDHHQETNGRRIDANNQYKKKKTKKKKTKKVKPHNPPPPHPPRHPNKPRGGGPGPPATPDPTKKRDRGGENKKSGVGCIFVYFGGFGNFFWGCWCVWWGLKWG